MCTVSLSQPATQGPDLSVLHPGGTKAVQALADIEAKASAGLLNGQAETEAAIVPRFLSAVHDQVVEEGATMYCEAILEPTKDANLKIIWTKDGESLPESKLEESTRTLHVKLILVFSLKVIDCGRCTCLEWSSWRFAECAHQIWACTRARRRTSPAPIR